MKYSELKRARIVALHEEREALGTELDTISELATTENHPSWTHMYQMMMLAQIGFALAYVF